jgi:predicted transcriptional regulator
MGPIFDRPPASNDTTSREAADAIAPSANTLRGRVLQFLRIMGPNTAQCLEAELPMDGNTLRPRLRELVKAGLVCDSGERRTLSNGRKAIIWRAR